MMQKDKNKILQVIDLKTYFFTENGVVKAVDGVDFEVYQGETLGLVGESGCGKSVTAFSTMGLLDYPGKTVGGQILFKGEDLLKKSEKQMRQIRGKDISMIFQEPMTSLNPVLTIGFQITEALEVHFKMEKIKARKKVIELLEKVGIPIPEQRIDEYPHQLSGGMRQRAMIAMALACDPALLIADEPTTSLDVTIQAQILELMKSLLEQFNSSMIMITHDLGVIAEIADRVAVMYAGKIVEYATTRSIFYSPLHPYTFGLLTSIPRLDMDIKKLESIPGVVPDPLHFPEGCKFNPRCIFATEKCRKEEPPLVEIEKNHSVSCWHIDKVKKEAQKVSFTGRLSTDG
ncbi:MAG: ABC transporter ATP-binding protein [Atribacterota bacterium]|nr:ABC transporter ATP-binding protein [Atribacterota bacterium]MDI9596741.1 ABC transporter ATP-binding protein [Atribacterota bacterium]